MCVCCLFNLLLAPFVACSVCCLFRLLLPPFVACSVTMQCLKRGSYTNKHFLWYAQNNSSLFNTIFSLYYLEYFLFVLPRIFFLCNIWDMFSLHQLGYFFPTQFGILSPYTIWDIFSMCYCCKISMLKYHIIWYNLSLSWKFVSVFLSVNYSSSHNACDHMLKERQPCVFVVCINCRNIELDL